MTAQSTALILKAPYIDLILDGDKTWEIRGRSTSKRGEIALIQSGSGQILGTCEIVDVLGPLSVTDLCRNIHAHRDRILPDHPPYEQTYAWVVKNPCRFCRPIPFRNPPGAVVWVKLPRGVGHLIQESTRTDPCQP